MKSEVSVMTNYSQINTQWRVFLLRWLMFTCGQSALFPPDKNKLITFGKKNATQLIPKQMWWALATVHPLWAFWCGETCWAAVSSFSNKAVISCQCALSWRGSKLAEINSACQGAVPRRNKAGRHMVSRPQGGSRQRSDWIWTPDFNRVTWHCVYTWDGEREGKEEKWACMDIG